MPCSHGYRSSARLFPRAWLLRNVIAFQSSINTTLVVQGMFVNVAFMLSTSVISDVAGGGGNLENAMFLSIAEYRVVASISEGTVGLNKVAAQSRPP